MGKCRKGPDIRCGVPKTTSTPDGWGYWASFWPGSTSCGSLSRWGFNGGVLEILTYLIIRRFLYKVLLPEGDFYLLFHLEPHDAWARSQTIGRRPSASTL